MAVRSTGARSTLDPALITAGPRDWILTLYGAFVRDFGGWIAVADLLKLLEPLDVSAESGRSALSRMKRRGEIDAVSRESERGYSLTPSADEWFEDGTPRIMVGPSPQADGQWAVASFSVPEKGRNERYRIRTRLQDLGFGQLSGGLMIAPAHILDESIRAMARAGLGHYVDFWQARHFGPRPLREIVGAAWDLDAIDRAYRHYLRIANDLRADDLRANDLRQRPGPADDGEAFVRYLANIHAWRELPFLDPGLALSYLPPDWPSEEARRVFGSISDDLRTSAWRHFVRVTAA